MEWGDSGSANGQFDQPRGIAVDPDTGLVYVADAKNNRIQKFDLSGLFLGKWGQSGINDGDFNEPYGIAIDTLGLVYVSDENQRIQIFDRTGVFQTKFGGFGFSDGFFYYPHGLTVNDSCQIYVADSFNHRLQRFGVPPPSSAPPFLLSWGSAGSGVGQFWKPYELAVEPWFVYVADAFNKRIQKFDSHGSFIKTWGSPGSGPGEFNEVLGVAVDNLGHVFVSDALNNRIQKFDTEGIFILAWGDTGTGDGEFQYPRGLACDSQANVYVAGNLNHRIQKFDNNGTFILKWGRSGSQDGKFLFPRGLTVDADDFVYVADGDNHRVQKFDDQGNFILKWGAQGSGDGEFGGARDVAVDDQGQVYVTDELNHRIQVFDTSGNFLFKWGLNGTGNGDFNRPNGIAADSCGRVYVADRENTRIQQFGDPAHCGPNTPVGTSVTVSFPGSNATTFASVSVEGITQINTFPLGPPPPIGILPVPQGTPVYYDVTTTAVHSGPIQVGLSYAPDSVQGSEDDLLLFHWDTSISPASWREVTILVDTGIDVIFGEINSLSTFLIVEPGSPTAVDDPTTLPTVFRMYPNFPNPFHRSTRIRYDLPEPGLVKVQVFDLQGRLVRSLVNREEDPGRYSIFWHGNNTAGQTVAPGIYFYRIETPENAATQKLLKIP
jgi:DNA-binding beta-propeller fold protein YncE